MSVAAILGAIGLGAVIAAALILRSIGPGLRLGRLLAGTRMVPIQDAIELARSGAPRYVRINGRITSDEEFPDDQDRPLVFRRTRLEIGQPNRAGGRGGRGGRAAWQTVIDEREAVPFAVETRSSSIGVDEVALGEGLVVIPRESIGHVGDLPADLRATLTDAAEAEQAARLTIEQLSAVEHATVCGVPVVRDGTPLMTAGSGRPLIVTTLDQPAAMRILAGGRRERVAIGTLLLTLGLALIAAAALALVVGA